MVINFQKDLNNARKAERLVMQVFQELDGSRAYKYTGDQREYFYKGDFLAIAADGREIGIEVKDDSRIAQTHNVLCEDKVLFYDGYWGKGNMQSDYNIYCVLSRAEGLIYVMDFAILKAKYKKCGFYKEIAHAE